MENLPDDRRLISDQNDPNENVQTIADRIGRSVAESKELQTQRRLEVIRQRRNGRSWFARSTAQTIDAKTQRDRGRAVFFEMLYHRAPEASRNIQASFDDLDSLRAHLSRFHLLDDWVVESALWTWTCQMQSKNGDTPLLVRSPDQTLFGRPPVRDQTEHSDKLSFVAGPGHDIYLDDLKHPDASVFDDDHNYLGDYEDDGHFASFDPREMKVDKAVEAILPVLERRLRSALQRIVDEDLAMYGGAEPVEIHDLDRFDWLVRYQVLRESIPKIAESEDLSRTYVEGTIKSTAKLIGLTRIPVKRGRKPNTKQRNSKA
jgi:hypothetical protein